MIEAQLATITTLMHVVGEMDLGSKSDKHKERLPSFHTLLKCFAHDLS
jgi:hypothetical protein